MLQQHCAPEMVERFSGVANALKAQVTLCIDITTIKSLCCSQLQVLHSARSGATRRHKLDEVLLHSGYVLVSRVSLRTPPFWTTQM